MLTATYVNTSQFTVPLHDYTDLFRIGTRVWLSQGEDGTLITDVSAVIYQAGENNTLVTVRSMALTENLTEVRRGHTFVDSINEESNLSWHSHGADWDGGLTPFGLFTDVNKVTRLNLLAAVDETVVDTLVGVNHAGNDLERKLLLGSDDIVVTHGVQVPGVGTVTFTTVQSIAQDASPEFAGITLSGLSGLLVGNGASAVSIMSTTDAGGKVLGRNTGNTAYEWKSLSQALSGLSDVFIQNQEEGHVLTWNAETQKWNARPPSGGGGSAAGLVFALMMKEGD